MMIMMILSCHDEINAGDAGALPNGNLFDGMPLSHEGPRQDTLLPLVMPVAGEKETLEPHQMTMTVTPLLDVMMMVPSTLLIPATHFDDASVRTFHDLMPNAKARWLKRLMLKTMAEKGGDAMR